jgi:hypothetical protein
VLTMWAGYIFSGYLFIIALILLIWLFVGSIKKTKSLDSVEKFHRRWVSPSVLSASIAIAFIEAAFILVNIFSGTMELDDKSLIAIITFVFILFFLIFYFVVNSMKLEWNKELIAMRLRVAGIMLVVFSFVNLLITVFTSNQASTTLRDSIIFLAIAIVCFFVGWASEKKEKNQATKRKPKTKAS